MKRRRLAAARLFGAGRENTSALPHAERLLAVLQKVGVVKLTLRGAAKPT